MHPTGTRPNHKVAVDAIYSQGRKTMRELSRQHMKNEARRIGAMNLKMLSTSRITALKPIRQDPQETA
jgi:hypothetical protein